MDTLKAFAKGAEARANGNAQKVFDWDRAARLILAKKPKVAEAGLARDWEYTGGTIYEDGKPVMDSYTYLSSNWASPQIDLDGELVDCWKYQDDVPDWNSRTKWPESALKILAGG